MPYKDRNFNTQAFGKMYLLVICMISRHWFQTKLLLYIAWKILFVICIISHHWFQTKLLLWGDFGAKMPFVQYIINQKRNNFIKHCPPTRYQEVADIRDVYLYKKLSVQVGSWYTGRGAMFHRQTITGVSAFNTQYTLSTTTNYVNRPLSDKSMKFCILVHVVHDLTNDISYNAKLNKS